jgi:hypothetical protein
MLQQTPKTTTMAETHCETFLNIINKLKTEPIHDESLELKANDLFRLIPRKFKTQEICETAFEHNPGLFVYIPYECKTQKMCNEYINYDTEYVSQIPEKYFTQEMCDTLFKRDITCINHIPKHFRTQEMWNVFGIGNITNLKNTPIKFQNAKTWNETLKIYLKHRIFSIFYAIPIEFINRETFDIVRQFSIPPEYDYFIDLWSYHIWKKRCAFCTIINQPGFERTTKLNLDVLKLVASFI